MSIRATFDTSSNDGYIEIDNESTFEDVMKKSVNSRSSEEHLYMIEAICRGYPTSMFDHKAHRNKVLLDYDLKVAYHQLKAANRTHEADAILARYKGKVNLPF